MTAPAQTSGPTATGGPGNRLQAMVRGLDRTERRSLIGMGAVMLGLHAVGFAVLFGLVVPERHQIGGSTPVFGGGVAKLADTFGLRPAFDAAHNDAVDNTTRKLLGDRAATETGRRPLSVAFWFSLGRSSI